MPTLPLFLRLLRHRRGNWISFVVIYALGLAVFLMVDGLSKNYQKDISAHSRELLEGDLRINARRPFTETEQKIIDSLIPKDAVEAKVFGFLSMLRTADSSGTSRLVQVKAISPEYPLLGAFKFAGAAQGKWSGKLNEIKSGEILFPSELLSALKIKVGEKVWLGNEVFTIKDEYLERPGGNFEFWEMGSRVYIKLSDLAATGLEQKGSRIFRYQFYNLPEKTDTKTLRTLLESALPDPEIEVTAANDSGTDLNRSFGMVTGFLKMVSLSAFLLAAVGAAFFFRHHLVGERKTIAILATLGSSRKKITRIYIWQNIFLSTLAAVTGMLLARLLSQGLPKLIFHLYHIEIPSSLPLSTVLLGLFISISTSLLFGISSFAGLGKIPPATLLKPLEDAPLSLGIRALLFLAQGGFFFAIAFWDSRSWVLSSISVGSMGGSFLLLGALGWGLFRGAWMLRSRLSYSLRIILGSIRWGREKSLLAFSALGFVAFSLTLIPQLQSLILNEISIPKGRAIPQLFLFDIQDEQVSGVTELIQKNGSKLNQPSPMIRARLEKVNGVLFKRDENGKVSSGRETLEEKNRRQFRNRGFNLSYRDSLSDAEKLVAGKWWTGNVKENALPELSLEKAFAKRLSLKLGDTLTFDVQGVETAGKITSFRQVRWASFQPNFFVLFQPGALEDAPKTFLGTVNQISGEQAEALQNRLAAIFPNVTLLNLKEVIGKTVDTLNKLVWLVRFLSLFALIIGLSILALIVNTLVVENQITLLLLRTLGEPRIKLVKLFLIHYTGFCTMAGLTGYFLSLLATWVINLVVWQVPWIPDMKILIVCVLSSLMVGLLAAIYAAYRGLGQPLKALLSMTK